jgi:lysophospholipid acyltransferase (LPLAT)-like uncharacterized protein
VPRADAAKISLLQHIASFLGGALLKLLAWTLRVRHVDEAGFYDPKRGRPLILCIWHNRLLGAVLGDYRARRPRPVPLSVLTSASRDGGWLAAIARRFRMGAVRGSSSRRGAAALVGLVRQIEAGGDVAITPDGPRGPNYRIAPGLLFLGQRTGAGVVPVEVQLSRFWRIGRKWDALWIPKPFARVTLIFHPPLTVTAGDAAIEAESARLDAAMGTK